MDKQYMESANCKQDARLGAAIGGIPGLQSQGTDPYACRELTIKEMLTRRADEYRREALRLEVLASEYLEGRMSHDAEVTLRFIVGSTLNR